MSYQVFVVVEHPTIKDLHVSSNEHEYSYQDYQEAVKKFHQLCAIHDWVELKDEDAEFNEHDGLSLSYQAD